MNKKEEIVQRFLDIVNGRNFVTFDELSKKLVISVSEMIRLKGNFEDRLMLEDDKIRLTSCPNKHLPGFEIES
jgi:hypothetical protein